jgi:hypothetical protein
MGCESVKQPEWYRFCGSDAEMSAEPMSFDCKRIVYSGFGPLVMME